MIKFLIEKEFKQIARHSFIPKLIFVMPLVMMLFLPWVADMEMKNINISIVDNDHSSYSERLVEKIAASTYFVLSDISADNDEAMKSIEANVADLILEIPSGFERNLIREGAVDMMISANAVNSTKGGIGSSYLSVILNDYASEIRESLMPVQGKTVVPVVGIVSQNRFNPHLDYKIFMIPALIVMLLTMIGGFLPALNIVGEKEQGTIEQMNVSPVGKFTFIIAKLIPYWVIGFVILSLCMLVAFVVYGLVPAGSIATVYFFSALYILVVSGLGLVISNYADTMQQAMFIMFFFMMILLLMSGLFTPVTSMPDWAQAITVINPLKYFIDVMRAVYLKGSNILQLHAQAMALCCFAVFFNLWAVLSYRKRG
ncbi:MAG: ABC transporter permease [Prevotellaceae bacterium]|jgi:ABC-2 type transport system permease protein|nr:ABC transporter permease [Prevotellaceae bacterium]